MHGKNPALSAIASRLGYESEAAFSRAFKRFVGISPGAARRREPRALHYAAVLPKR
jgi:AraC-like DNA-binding protein